jgi:hypothetical protein
MGEQGTPHLQGYVIFKRKVTLAGIKKNINATASFHPRNGTHEQARHYCMKPVDGCACEHCEKARNGPPNLGPFQEWGEEPKPGARNDLNEVKASVDAGISTIQLWDDYFPTMVKYHSGITKYQLIKTPRRDFKTQVAVLWGETGTGKTRACYDLPQDDCFWLDNARSTGDPWVDGYDPLQHKHLILDDFYGWIKWHTLLRLLDRYPFSMESKGGKIQVRPKYIWITSNRCPSEWYDHDKLKVEYKTLHRRFNIIKHYIRNDDGTVEEKIEHENWDGVPMVVQESDTESEDE